MKYVFAAGLLVFAVAYALAIGTLQTPDPPGVTTLRWATDPNPARTMQIGAFAALHPDIHVKVDSDDASRLLIQCATGVGPDVMDLSADTTRSMAEAGVLLDLTDIARSDGFSPELTYPSIRPALMVNGRQYRFPCSVSVQAILYNRRIFDDHHVPYPKPDWSWDDFVTAGRAILHNPSDSGRKHLALVNAGPAEFFNDLLASHGARYFSEDGRRCVLDSPEAVAAMQQFHDFMYVSGVIPRPNQSAAMSSQGGWGAGEINWFSDGEAAMLSIGRWYIVQLVNYPDLKPYLAAARMPHLPGQPSRVMATTRAAGINVRSPHRAAALQFLSYLASPGYSALIVQDGDALPPSPEAALDGRMLANSAMPDPAFHQVFVDAVNNAVTQDQSAYIDTTLVDRWTLERINQVENQVVSPDEAMHSLSREINQTIELNLSRRPDLREMAARRR